MMPKAAQLAIMRKNHELVLCLRQTGATVRIQEVTAPPIVLSAADEQCLTRAQRQANQEHTDSDGLETYGRLLYTMLCSAPLQEPLRLCTDPLTVTGDLGDWPWELLYDDVDGQFLGLRRAVGRRPAPARPARAATAPLPAAMPAAVPKPPHAGGDDPAPDADLESGIGAFLLVGDPLGKHEELREEVQRLDSTLSERGGHVVTIAGQRASARVVLSELASGETFVCLHFACPAVYDKANDEAALLLSEGTQLRPQDLGELRAAHPLLFLDTYDSGATATSGQRPGLDPHAAAALALPLLQAERGGVVVAQGEVQDWAATELVQTFYAGVLEELPVGEALRRAKLAYHTAHPNDPSWAAYVLYGNPAAPALGPLPQSCFVNGVLDRKRFESPRGGSAGPSAAGSAEPWLWHHDCAAAVVYRHDQDQGRRSARCTGADAARSEAAARPAAQRHLFGPGRDCAGVGTRLLHAAGAANPDRRVRRQREGKCK